MIFIESLDQRRLLSAASSFGDNGTLQLGQNVQIVTEAMQTDGKMLLVERPSQLYEGDTNYLRIRRLLADGSADSSFGTNGVVEFDDPRVLRSIKQIVQLPNGELLVAGQSISTDKVTAGALVKLKSDGSLDTSFGGSAKGYASTPAGAAWVGVPADDDDELTTFSNLAVAADGRIAASGLTYTDDIRNSSYETDVLVLSHTLILG